MGRLLLGLLLLGLLQGILLGLLLLGPTTQPENEVHSGPLLDVVEGCEHF